MSCFVPTNAAGASNLPFASDFLQSETAGSASFSFDLKRARYQAVAKRRKIVYSKVILF
jgi:hypothetical protein